MNALPDLIAKLLNDAPFRSNQIHERDRWLIEEAYKAGYQDGLANLNLVQDELP